VAIKQEDDRPILVEILKGGRFFIVCCKAIASLAIKIESSNRDRPSQLRDDRFLLLISGYSAL